MQSKHTSSSSEIIHRQSLGLVEFRWNADSAKHRTHDTVASQHDRIVVSTCASFGSSTAASYAYPTPIHEVKRDFVHRTSFAVTTFGAKTRDANATGMRRCSTDLTIKQEWERIFFIERECRAQRLGEKNRTRRTSLGLVKWIRTFHS